MKKGRKEALDEVKTFKSDILKELKTIKSETISEFKTAEKEAIKKLENGIFELNKEGRERLLKSFDKVNENFKK